MSQAIDIYLKYCAMKAHFGEGDYDYVKFKGKSKVSRESFWKRKDRIFFVSLGRKYDAHLIDSVDDYLLANFVVENKGWIGKFSDENYYKWKDRMSRLSQIFENDLNNFNIDDLTVPNNSHPKLLRDYLGKRISLETMIILDGLLDYTSKWDKKMEDDIVWPKTKKLINDYKKFLTYEKEKCKMILIKLTKTE